MNSIENLSGVIFFNDIKLFGRENLDRWKWWP